MQGEVTANLSTMPVANIIALFTGIAGLLIIAATVVIVIVQKLRIRSFGPFKMEHDNTATMHDMNEKIRDIDDLCHKQMRYMTDRMKNHISNLFLEINICVPARFAISSAIRLPLYDSIANNHFTKELTERYAAYRERIIENMKDEYVSLAMANKNEQCNRDKLPPWEQMSGQITGCIDLWLKRVAKEVMDACEKKIPVYRKYQRGFEESKDGFRAGICKECAEKNERYSRELQRLI